MSDEIVEEGVVEYHDGCTHKIRIWKSGKCVEELFDPEGRALKKCSITPDGAPTVLEWRYEDYERFMTIQEFYNGRPTVRYTIETAGLCRDGWFGKHLRIEIGCGSRTEVAGSFNPLLLGYVSEE